MSRKDWKLALRLIIGKDDDGEYIEGHRYWRHQNGRIAVADQSGDGRFEIGCPEDTDDGILWLDLSRPIVLGRDRDESATIPLYRSQTMDNGRTEYCTGERNVDAVRVAFKFGARLEIGGYELFAREKASEKWDDGDVLQAPDFGR